MIKKIIPLVLAILLMFCLISPTNAAYQKTFALQSGLLTYEPDISLPPAPTYENIAQIKNGLQLSSGSMIIDTFVTNGPIKFSLTSGSLTGALTTNRNVSISGSSCIHGPVHRQETNFHPQKFDYSIVPSDIKNLGDFSTSHTNTISSSGEYYNVNISTPLTIDTTKNDVVLVAHHLNVSDDINIIGKHRAILIVKNNMNVNGHRSINYKSNHNNFDLVVQAWSLSLQNQIQIKGRLYFEGTYLYIRNGIEIDGAVFAPNAYVELSASQLYGALNCDNISIQSKGLISAEKK